MKEVLYDGFIIPSLTPIYKRQKMRKENRKRKVNKEKETIIYKYII